MGSSPPAPTFVEVATLSVSGFDQLEPDELAFFVLLGQLNNELTILLKLALQCPPPSSNHTEQRAGVSFTLFVLKHLALKLWQGWELIQNVYQGNAVSKAGWLRDDAEIVGHIRSMKREFYSGCRLERIRHKSAAHYDANLIRDSARVVFRDNPMEYLHADKIMNGLHITSDHATWEALLETADDGTFDVEYPKAVDYVAERTGEALRLVNLLTERFTRHVVEDLGGHLQEVMREEVHAVGSKAAILPLFSQ